MTSYRSALEGLRSAQKPAYGVPAYSRFVNRPLGRRLAAAAAVIGLTPTQVTAASAAASGLAIVVVAASRPQAVVGVAVSILLVVGYALDAADGQLARLTDAGSAAGEWLDHSLDAVKISALHLAVLIGLHRSGAVDARWLWAPVLFEVVAVSRFSSMLLIDQLRRRAPAGVRTPPTESSTARAFAALVIDYGVLCLLFLIWGRPTWFVAAYSVLAVGNLGYASAAFVAQYQELSRWQVRTREVAP